MLSEHCVEYSLVHALIFSVHGLVAVYPGRMRLLESLRCVVDVGQ